MRTIQPLIDKLKGHPRPTGEGLWVVWKEGEASLRWFSWSDIKAVLSPQERANPAPTPEFYWCPGQDD